MAKHHARDFTPLRRYLLVSLGVHLAVFLLAYVVPKFFSWVKPTTKIVWVQLPTGISYDTEQIRKAEDLPQSTIQEQLEALKKQQDSDKEIPGKEPEAVKSEPAKELEKPTLVEEKREAAKPEPKPEPKPKPKPAPKKVNPKTAALNKKIAAALSKNKQAIQEKEVPIEAAQVPEGGTGAGSLSHTVSAETMDPVYAQYYALIKERINREWVTAPKLFDTSEDLKALLVVRIDRQGTVIETTLDQSSGNYSFDLSAERAIEHASPLPTPPPGLEEEVLNEGFLIEFSPMKVER